MLSVALSSFGKWKSICIFLHCTIYCIYFIVEYGHFTKKTLKSCNNIEDNADTSLLLKLKNVALSNPSPSLNDGVSKSYKLFHFTNPRLLLVLFRRLFFLIDGKESKRR